MAVTFSLEKVHGIAKGIDLKRDWGHDYDSTRFNWAVVNGLYS